MYVRRPVVTEDEDDLVKQQEEFFKNKKPCLEDEHIHPNKTSDFKKVHFDEIEVKVIHDIVEKNINHFQQKEHIRKNLIDDSNNKNEVISNKYSTNSEKKQSLFAIQFKKNPEKFLTDSMIISNFKIGNNFLLSNSENDEEITLNTNGVIEKNVDLLNQVSKSSVQFLPSRLVSGEGLVKSKDDLINEVKRKSELEAIHQSNVKYLSSLSEAEIFEKRNELLHQLDPNLLDFLKKKHKDNNTFELSDDKIPLPEKLTSANIETKTSSTNLKSNENQLPDSNENQLPDSKKSNPTVEAISSNYPNLGKIEPEKLAWIGELEPVSDILKSSNFPARFGFDGCLIGCYEDLPVHLGLHHHGEEAQRAGYTIQELLTLARSFNSSQRVFALNTLSRILVRARENDFENKLTFPLLPMLLCDGGFIMFARMALDHTNLTSLVAACNLMHAILINSKDEELLDYIFDWPRGSEWVAMVPNFEPVEYINYEEDENTSNKSKSDVEIIKEDLILGLLRTNILPRLRYILSKCQPPITTIIKIIEIIIRICRHSSHSAHQVWNCSGLMDIIAEYFLPLNIDDEDHDKSIPQVYKLFRVIASTGKHLASLMVDKYSKHLFKLLQKDCCNEDSSFNTKECRLESVKLLRVLFLMGLALEKFSQLFHDSIYHQIESIQCEEIISTYSCYVALLESAINACGEEEFRALIERNYKPNISWKYFSTIHPNIALILRNQLSFFGDNYYKKKYSLTSLSVLLNYFATTFSRLKISESLSNLSTIEDYEKLSILILHNCILPCLKDARSMSLVLVELRKFSFYLDEKITYNNQTVSNLPDLGISKLLFTNDRISTEKIPVHLPTSSIVFLLTFVKLLTMLLRIDRPLAVETSYLFLNYSDLSLYIKKIVQCHYKLNETEMFSWSFIHHENQFQIALLQLLVNLVCEKDFENKSNIDLELWHSFALTLTTRLASGSESNLIWILEKVIFSEQFIGSKFKKEKLKTRCCKGSIYSEAFIGRIFKEQQLKRSKSCCQMKCFEINNLVHSGPNKRPLLLLDWPFTPLLDFYRDIKTCELNNKENTIIKNKEKLINKNQEESKLLYIISNCLHSIEYLETELPFFLKSLDPALKYSRVLCTFLAGNDLFFDPFVRSTLQKLCSIYAQHVNLPAGDLLIPGQGSFRDLFNNCLNQFDAVGFRDEIFAQFIVIAIQQKQDYRLRLAFWGCEGHDALGYITLGLNNMPVALDNFLIPDENRPSLIRFYYQVLVEYKITAIRNPLLYLIAIHHLNRFIFYHQNKIENAEELVTNSKTAVPEKSETKDGKMFSRLKKSMLNSIISNWQGDLKHHVLFYKNENKNEKYCFELYDQLPKSRQQTYDRSLSSN